MTTDTLLQTILVDLQRKLEAEGAEEARYVAVALATLEEFVGICQKMTNFNEDLGLVLTFNNATPVGLRAEDTIPYVLYVHKLFSEGECYGMMQEDPLSSLVLLGSAFRLVKDASAADCTNYALVTWGLDFLLYQALALQKMNQNELAKQHLKTILEVASDMESLTNTYNVQDPYEILVDVAARAAPSAWLISRILYVEDDLTLSKEALERASKLYEQVVPKFSSKRNGCVAVLLGFAEVLATEDRMVSCAHVLDKAIKVATKLLKTDVTASKAFMASVAYHRRGELCAMADEWDGAFKYFEKSLTWISTATKKAPNNTHYKDRHAEYLNELGILHGVRGDIISAQKVFLDAINRQRILVGQSEKYKSGLVAVLNNMSILMNRYGNLPVAKHYLQESIEVVDGMKDSYNKADREDMRTTLTMTLESLEKLMRERKTLPWRPIWNPDQSSSLPN